MQMKIKSIIILVIIIFITIGVTKLENVKASDWKVEDDNKFQYLWKTIELENGSKSINWIDSAGKSHKISEGDNHNISISQVSDKLELIFEFPDDTRDYIITVPAVFFLIIVIFDCRP